MSLVRLTWVQKSVADAFNVYRSDSQMNVNSMPPPLAVLDKSARSFDDLSIDLDHTYYYRVGAVRGSKVMFSDESKVMTFSDPNNAYLTNHLEFKEKNLMDSKTNESWVVGFGSVSYIESGAKFALEIKPTSFIESKNTLTSTNVFSILIDIEFNANASYQQNPIFFIGRYRSDTEGVSIFRSASGLAMYKGSSGALISTTALTNSKRMQLKIIKKASQLQLYINDSLIGTANSSVSTIAASKIFIGADFNTNRALDAKIYEVKYFHNRDITT